MRRNDIHKVMIIGSGPIIIGQACEFDYSGTQALSLIHICNPCSRSGRRRYASDNRGN